MAEQEKPATIATEGLSTFVERIEALEAERRVLDARILDTYVEAGERGLHVGALQELVELRRPEAVRETNALIDPRIRRAAALYNQHRTVKQVAEAMGIGNGTAGRLRQSAESLGLLLKGPPAAVVDAAAVEADDIPSRPIPEMECEPRVSPGLTAPQYYLWWQP